MKFLACSWRGQGADSDSLCAADIIRRSILHGLLVCRRKTTASAARGGQKPHKTLWKRIQNEIAFHRAEKIFEPVLFVVVKRTGDGALLSGSGYSLLAVITFIQDF